jgi:hypothetical protein
MESQERSLVRPGDSAVFTEGKWNSLSKDYIGGLKQA